MKHYKKFKVWGDILMLLAIFTGVAATFTIININEQKTWLCSGDLPNIQLSDIGAILFWTVMSLGYLYYSLKCRKKYLKALNDDYMI